MKKNYILLLFLFFLGCARTQTLNLQPHFYSERPNQILWIQLAGFSEEQIPLLKFNSAEADYKSHLEQVDCVGKMWSFNLFQLRPSAHLSFLSQMTGTKNIQGKCNDFENPSLLSKFEEFGYAVSILENGAIGGQSLESALMCPANNFLSVEKIRFYKMGTDLEGNKKSFHYQDSLEQVSQFVKPGLYFDRSCQKSLCFSTLSNNFKTLWQQNLKTYSKNLFIVRDFNFQKALLKKDLSLAKEALLEIERIVGDIRKNQNNQLLVVISGGESLPIEFPFQGKEWGEYAKSGKNLFYKASSLMSPVTATGPMSENFCGIFDEVEIYKRLLFKPQDKKFNWDYLKPF